MPFSKAYFSTQEMEAPNSSETTINFSIRLHGVISQKIVLLVIIAMLTLNVKILPPLFPYQLFSSILSFLFILSPASSATLCKLHA
jgi:hypothetical protein